MKHRTSSVVLAIAASAVLTACEAPPAATTQVGYRGTGMEQVAHPATTERVLAANVVPEATPLASSDGPRASEVFQNVHVLGDLSAAQFTRLMVAITSWVAPQQGCNYCHAPTDLASDSVYAKVVARRMLQMTRHINSNQGDLGAHVGATGVTCYTCHRGSPIPANVWSINPGPAEPAGAAAHRGGQNLAYEAVVGYTSLPYDPFSPYLKDAGQIRVVSTQALPKSGAGTGPTIQATEATYGLMMHMSGALGVNCTFCHNSRSFAAWDASRPTRVTAWHAIRTVRDINTNYIEPLAPLLPAAHKGPSGDSLKANCATCHQGLNKPLNGVSMLKDYPELAAARAGAAAPAAATPAPAPAATPPSM
jgi:photosynthetic reaction center cytochrome c subunit